MMMVEPHSFEAFYETEIRGAMEFGTWAGVFCKAKNTRDKRDLRQEGFLIWPSKSVGDEKDLKQEGLDLGPTRDNPLFILVCTS